MHYIHAIATISHQDSFQTKNLWSSLTKLEDETELINPVYKDFISAGVIRRLSPILKLGLTASIDCQNNMETPFDAIVVGTALGCLKDTEKFLQTFNTFSGDFLPPTSFIQSTHNTIGGNISLALGNHSYNMTHTQNNVSFEVSLIDAMMCVDEGKKSVLVGSADEKIEFLELVQPSLIPSNYPLSSCASFYALSGTPNDSGIVINNVAVEFAPIELSSAIANFLAKNNLTSDQIDLILHSDLSEELVDQHANAVNYLDYSGMNYSASAFATHLAHDYLNENSAENVLIINNLCVSGLGLILVSKIQD